MERSSGKCFSFDDFIFFETLAQVLSFLALRQGDADTATLASANTMTQVWARLVIAVELLEKKRSRLSALSALSGLG